MGPELLVGEVVMQAGDELDHGSVITWGWIFLAAYLILILGLGYIGYQRVEGGRNATSSQDEYATARGGFGFLALALAYAATVASGATFMSIPGMGYDMGFMAGYYALIYPIGVFIGAIIIARVSKKVSDRFNSQSVPDLIGDRFQSPGLRVITAVLSLFLIFYAMAQISAAGWMFEVILGVEYVVGIWVAGLLLLVYLAAGGSHADILTDAVQGAIMIGIAVLVMIMFVIGWGIDGGMSSVNAALESGQQWDQHTDSDNPYFTGWWAILLLMIAHIGFTAQPHLGNKFFAIKSNRYMRRFLLATSFVGIFLPVMYLGGILGAAQGIEVSDPDAIIPTLFVENLHPIMAAFLGIVILSAIISTSDGLVISISQIFANDLYRKSYVPWKGGDPESEAVQQRSLLISRVSTIFIVFVAVAAVITPPEYLVVFMWTGIGGIISSFGGPYLIGLLWRRATKHAAYAAIIVGFTVYFFIHLGPQFGVTEGVWPLNENPYASTGIGFIVSVVTTVVVSFFTEPPGDEHLEEVFSAEQRLIDDARYDTDTGAPGPASTSESDD
ncbi:sodium/proline symporter [Natronorubrum sediminis]|uniref:Sodium/proline symporter n=1 Tax=Natronorubrum sediminis TaxID=640943 RepID=A0A1H6G779_9EURY|nr:sodium:solute symporter family protein [Natronorubrum sediminis]SEH17844.1 sodium/proline symporter [Natronorubrum sediminis]